MNENVSLSRSPVSSSSSNPNPEPQTPPSRPPYSESRGHYDDEEEYRRQLADQTRRGYYSNPQKYKDTEL